MLPGPLKLKPYNPVICLGERKKYFLGEQLDSVMGYPFRNGILSFINGNIPSYELNDIYMNIKENYPPESFKSNLNLLGSHDVERLKTALHNDKDKVNTEVVMDSKDNKRNGDVVGRVNVYVNEEMIGYRYLYLSKRSVRDNKSIFSKLIDILKRIGNND